MDGITTYIQVDPTNCISLAKSESDESQPVGCKVSYSQWVAKLVIGTLLF